MRGSALARRSTPNISDAARQYVSQEFARSGSRGMRYSNRSLLTRFAVAMNDCQVGSLKAERIEAWFYEPGGLAESCARSTLGKYRNDLKGFLAWCFRRRWCDDPELLLGGIRDRSTRVGRQRLRLSEADMWRLAEHAESARDRALLVFIMHTAVRVSEALSVRLSDLRLDSGQVRLRIAKTHDEDTVNVAPALDRALREWLTVYTEHENPPRTGYLFPARRRPRGAVTYTGWDSARPVTNPRNVIRGMAERADVYLEDGDGWHTIRRSVARIFFDRASGMGHDAAMRMTSALLHHKNTQTTEIYLGLQVERAKRDEIMTVGFLSDPANESAVSLEEFRRGKAQ